jgi:indolepyruvate ferredoxin oxidoreductase beta subunit
MDCPVLISETHGMAQRGGNVISHLKVGNPRSLFPSSAPARGFSSPLIRPGKADVLIALHPDGVAVHGFFLKTGGALICNSPEPQPSSHIDANRLALELGSPIAANLVVLGFAAASGALFCTPEAVRMTIERQGGKRLETSLRAYQAGCEEALRRATALTRH